MSTVRFHMTMSLDGYTAGTNQSPDMPFGDMRMDHFDGWLFALKTAREMFGLEGGETGPSDDVFRERFTNVGAFVMGRNMFGGGRGPWNKAEPWNGWWGENPPYHCPVFVLTNFARDPQPMEGGTTFYFVTDGIESAFRRAEAAAEGKDVVVAGGANVINQSLAAGLVDEFELHLVPQVIGAGEKLFVNLGGSADPQLEQIRAVQGSGVTHLKYRIIR